MLFAFLLPLMLVNKDYQNCHLCTIIIPVNFPITNVRPSHRRIATFAAHRDFINRLLLLILTGQLLADNYLWQLYRIRPEHHV